MPHVQAKQGKRVNLDNGVFVDEHSSINVDVTLPIAAAALAAGNIVQLDSVAAPKGAPAVLPVLTVSGAISDASFASPPPTGSLAVDVTNNFLYIKVGVGVWKKVAVA